VTLSTGSTLLSVEAARVLGTGPGGSVQLRIPGRPTPLALPVSGVVDLTRAQPLFASRKATKLEEFLYVPDVVVVTPETFRDEIVPAFDRARASVGSVMKRFPVQELDATIERERLRADPAAALAQTTRIADAIDRIAPGQGYLIDNISNTLTVAVGDAAVGRRMFLFLGLPGVLMAAFLAAYAGGLLAAAQRREQANLRVRGAHRGHLRRIAVYKALAFAAAGSLVGIAFGLASAMTILGPAAFGGVPLGHLAVSGLIAAGVGAMITAVALYLPARRSVDREVSEERREMAVPRPPMWWRLRLDLAMLAVAAVIEVAAVRSVALSPPQGSVYLGVAISLPSWPLLVPLVVWVAGLLVCVRLLLAVVSRVPREPSRRFGPVLRGLLARSIRRRPWSAATGVLGLGLIVGFGVSLAIFIASYDTAKAADATFTVGADLRITPSALASRPLGPGDGSAFVVPGISAVSPVVFGIENSVLVGPHDQGAANLAAIDPATFADVAPTPVAPAPDGAPTDVLAALAADPSGVLVDAEAADDLGIEPGDSVEVILALGTKRETRKRFRVAGVFERFPAFPEGANLVVNLETFASATGRADVDFFLADATLDGRVGLDRAIEALRSGPGAADPIRIDSTETALAKDQSSLTAVNVNGLVGMASFYVVVMSAASVAMFVFGLMLQRRREYVTLLAQGMRMRELHGLVFGEAALVALGGVAGGLLVGVGTAFLFVDVLRALFVLEPNVTVPIGRIALLVGSVVLATFGSGLAATETLRRLRPTEILREE
jgi:putative ABC transport system permease protein